MMIRILTALTLASVCCVATAAVYKYVDPQGRVHYADQPKPGWKRVDVPPPVISNDGPAPEYNAESQRKAVTAAADCARKEEQLRSYRAATKITERDSLGRDKQFTDDERKLLIAKAEQEVDECKATPSSATPPY